MLESYQRVGNGLADRREMKVSWQRKAKGQLIFHSRTTKSLMNDWHKIFLEVGVKKGHPNKEFWLKSV